MKFDGTNWVNVGMAGFTGGNAFYTSLAFSPAGKPYVAYMDYANSTKATVSKYDYPTGINVIKHPQLLFYPNPATNKITFEFSGATKENVVSIVNIEGQELITRQISEPITTIDVSTLSSGVYFVRLTNDRTVEVGKIVKQ
jgi:hypothetical protein